LNISKPENKNSQLTKWFSGSLIINVFSAAISFIVNLILANFLGKQEYGILAYATNWRALLAIPSTLGMDRLIVRENAVYKSNDEWNLSKGLLNFSSLLTFLISSLLAFIAFGIVSLNHQQSLFQTTFLLIICTLPLQSLRTIRISTMQGFNKIILALLPDAVLFPSLFLLLLLSARLLFEVRLTSTLVASFDVVAIIASFLLGIYLFRVSVPDSFKTVLPSYRMRSWLQATWPFTLYYMVFAINTRADILILGLLKGTDEVGLYSIASRAPEILSFSLLAINRSISPTVASLHSQGNTEELQRVVDKANKISLAFTLPLALLLVLFSSKFLSLFGKDFVDARLAMIILVVSQLVNVCTGPTAILMSMTYNQKQSTMLLFVSSCLNLLLNFLLIPRIGMTGAAISALSSSLLNNIVSAAFIRRQVGILSYFHI
jgi:O-antigen/teichoic acid export membrane protein